MELHEAMLQISAIREQMARTEQFRGYRAVPVAFSALLAFAAGTVQSLVITDPEAQLDRYLLLWVTVAALGFALCMTGVWLRYRRSTGLLHKETTRFALSQFAPCLVAGALLTVVLRRSAAQTVWMLPGLWAILFSLGLFASWRLLPRAIFGVAAYFLAAGLYVLSLGDPAFTLSPWTMPLLFGVGQLLTSALLFRDEKRRGETP